MADSDPTPPNLLFLAAANPALSSTGSPEWDRRFARWLMLDGLARADIDFGACARANEAHELVKLRIEETYGRDWRSDPEATKEREATWKDVTTADDQRSTELLEPLWQAAIDLALVPAPNLPAALFKIELIKREELDNYTAMTRDPFEIVAEDMANLIKGAAQ